jgi:AraC-like DNA-binding protein
MEHLLVFLGRGVAVGLLLALILLGASLASRARRALLPMLVCLGAYLLRSAPELEPATWVWLGPLALGALLFPVAFWWLVRNVFADRSDLPVPAVACAVVLVAAGLATSVPGVADLFRAGNGFHAVQKVAAAGFVVSALWQLWKTSTDDLVPGRRVLRMWLLGYAGLHGLAVLLAEWMLRGTTAPVWLEGLNVLAITLALAVSVAFVVRLDPQAIRTLFGPQGGPAPVPGSGSAPAGAATAAMPRQAAEAPAAPSSVPPVPVAEVPADAAWLQRLDQLMAEGRAYRDPELSVAALAAQLGLPEYRLRELINRQLGWRNFPAFVNAYRLREVEQKLADPAHAQQPILTLALEAGFGSIGPFNRAFRERHGVTPSEFRGGHAGRAAPAR